MSAAPVVPLERPIPYRLPHPLDEAARRMGPRWALVIDPTTGALLETRRNIPQENYPR